MESRRRNRARTSNSAAPLGLPALDALPPLLRRLVARRPLCHLRRQECPPPPQEAYRTCASAFGDWLTGSPRSSIASYFPSCLAVVREECGPACPVLPANSSSGVRFCDSGIPESGISGCNRSAIVLVNCCIYGGYELGWAGRVIAPLFSRAKFKLNSPPCSCVLLGRRLCGAAKLRPAVGRPSHRKLLTKGAFTGLSSKQGNGATGADASEALQRPAERPTILGDNCAGKFGRE